jgi:hypothetical protein
MQLCGFDRVHLRPGEERALVFWVPLKELSYYDEASGTFAPDSQTSYRFMIGAGSGDIRGEKILEGGIV